MLNGLFCKKNLKKKTKTKKQTKQWNYTFVFSDTTPGSTDGAWMLFGLIFKLETLVVRSLQEVFH